MAILNLSMGILAIIIGLLVLIWPKILRLAVGFYFLLWGILQLI
jgi:uncharacterized membrane protein HdeD (DUF308 family)